MVTLVRTGRSSQGNSLKNLSSCIPLATESIRPSSEPSETVINYLFALLLRSRSNRCKAQLHSRTGVCTLCAVAGPLRGVLPAIQGRLLLSSRPSNASGIHSNRASAQPYRGMKINIGVCEEEDPQCCRHCHHCFWCQPMPLSKVSDLGLSGCPRRSLTLFRALRQHGRKSEESQPKDQDKRNVENIKRAMQWTFRVKFCPNPISATRKPLEKSPTRKAPTTIRHFLKTDCCDRKAKGTDMAARATMWLTPSDLRHFEADVRKCEQMSVQEYRHTGSGYKVCGYPG